ncbi:hypothetical protein CfE428DRAFT_1227 [Chthoniobacter flavus Ellin428]|uniref:Uncharacterized protein n=1 Tax=Chthoniobacter flavus Ellin428 TaxID=497964 RepID=B4CXD6_9BACT|nr:hypothetical protein [Chthoniobacter flavus]EDY20934.1 hypothetical protein CfE428DRAFT_1227 [Chthoniobacter flavus Ellin428]TCO88664.1 hypothetical protein EV701_11636 [Chthoniobacter flavus]
MTRKFCTLLVVPSLFLGVLTSCDQKPVTPKPKAEKKPYLGSPEVRFTEARSQMIDGHFNDAAKSFEDILTVPKIRQPLQTWIEFHQGLALLLAGKQTDAQVVFGKIESDGPFTKAGSDSQIAQWFVNIAQQLHSKDPIPPAQGRDYDKWSYEGISLLALGLKDWNMEKYDDATALFRQFNDAAPEKMVEWADGPADLKKLKSIGDNFVNDYKEFEPANKALVAAKEAAPEDQMAAVETAKAARAKMKLTSKMSETLDGLIAEIEPKASAMIAAKNKTSADEMAADDKALTDAKTKRQELMDKFQFAEAKTAISDANLKTEKARDEQELLTKKVSWLANFKSQLIEDLAKKGYAQPIENKSGDKVAGGVATADQQQLTLKAGGAKMPWSDLSPDSAYQMGLSFIDKDMPPEIMSFRKWHLGVFAFYAGKKKEALDLLRAAAELRPVFKDELPLFEKPPEGAF